jgi:hypothetical protein
MKRLREENATCATLTSRTEVGGEAAAESREVVAPQSRDLPFSVNVSVHNPLKPVPSRLASAKIRTNQDS